MGFALLFSGQGAQLPTHLEYLRRAALPALGADLQALIADLWAAAEPAPELLLTNRYAQPLIYAWQMDRWLKLRADLAPPLCVAGYSLGEMAACCATGVYPLARGLELCAARARLMDACVAAPAGLLAILGLGAEDAKDIARHCGLEIAIRNGAEHFVLGGPAAGLEAAASLATARGAARVIRLGVGVPSHTSPLAPASLAFAELVHSAADGALEIPLLSAIDGRLLRSRGAALDALARQISMPLDWQACLHAVEEMQPQRVLEIGPGDALARMWRDLDNGIPVRAVDDFRSEEGILRWLAAA